MKYTRLAMFLMGFGVGITLGGIFGMAVGHHNNMALFLSPLFAGIPIILGGLYFDLRAMKEEWRINHEGSNHRT